MSSISSQKHTPKPSPESPPLRGTSFPRSTTTSRAQPMSQIRVLSHPSAALPLSPPSRRKLPISFAGNPMRFGTVEVCRIDSVGNRAMSLLVGGRGRVGEALLRSEKRNGDDGRGGRVICAVGPAAFDTQTLHWISAISTMILMFAKGTPIAKSFLPPYFVLQAPACVVSWFRSEYGTWTAFLALLVHLFHLAPGLSFREEVELPLMAMLLSITYPTHTLSPRGTPTSAIISLVIACYLAHLHFTKIGSAKNAFDSTSIFASLALICIVAVPLLLLFIY